MPLKSAIEPIFRFISPCSVVVTVWLSLKTLVPLGYVCKISMTTVLL